jgi:hypothetical protein
MDLRSTLDSQLRGYDALGRLLTVTDAFAKVTG